MALKKIIVLVLILAVPGFLYYLLTAQGKNRYKPLPFFGPKQVAGTSHIFHGKKIPDTIFHQVPDFQLQDQDRRKVSFETLQGEILVVNFFFSRSGLANKQVMASMDSVAAHFGTNKLVTLASITVDPDRDNAAALKMYRWQVNRPTAKWLFLNGDTTQIYGLARNGLYVDAFKLNNENFVCSNQIVLLDSHHRIRGYYDGTKPDEITRLADEIRVQLTEELRAKEKPLY